MIIISGNDPEAAVVVSVLVVVLVLDVVVVAVVVGMVVSITKVTESDPTLPAASIAIMVIV